MNDTVKIMLVEDNPNYREVIELALNPVPELELSSVFGTAEIALRSIAYKNHETPEVLLLDLNLPGLSGLEALPIFKKYLPRLKVIILTQSDREQDVFEAISMGAQGYLLKSASIEEIIVGIKDVVANRLSIDAGVAQFVLKKLNSQKNKRKLEVDLSEREFEILKLLSDGLVKKEIANNLGIQYSTVDTHVSHIYQKLEVKNAPAAINQAYKLGIFQTE